jgi:D-arabinose 5-phosphate isomerase GutQ
MTDRSDYSQVVELLRAESEAIAKAASRLRAEEVDRVIALLTGCQGKIILLGHDD